MDSNRFRYFVINKVLTSVIVIALCGCEGWNRKHDYTVVDVKPPAEDAEIVKTRSNDVANFADKVEELMETRERYLGQLRDLERLYLQAGDSGKAGWARRQRAMTEAVEVYPYLTAAPAEHRAEVSPQESIPEADAVYNKALAIHNQVKLIPLAGALSSNKKKAKESLDLFKQVLNKYPTSDKVDDCAFYCGEIYKEYLREDDPDDELSVRYYQWAAALDAKTPHPARFQCAVVYDFRRHDRARAIELYNQVLETEENGNNSNQRFSASRIEQLTDEQYSHLKPQLSKRAVAGEPQSEPVSGEPRSARKSGESSVRPAADKEPSGGE